MPWHALYLNKYFCWPTKIHGIFKREAFIRATIVSEYLPVTMIYGLEPEPKIYPFRVQRTRLRHLLASVMQRLRTWYQHTISAYPQPLIAHKYIFNHSWLFSCIFRLCRKTFICSKEVVVYVGVTTRQKINQYQEISRCIQADGDGIGALLGYHCECSYGSFSVFLFKGHGIHDWKQKKRINERKTSGKQIPIVVSLGS